MPTIEIAASAKNDLEEIRDYVGQYNPDAAVKLLKDITGKFALLRDNPLVGRSRADLIIDLRSFVVRKYIIFYFPTTDGVEILRVLHSSRDSDKTFEEFFRSLRHR